MNFSENHNKQELNPGECQEPVGNTTQSCKANTQDLVGLRHRLHKNMNIPLRSGQPLISINGASHAGVVVNLTNPQHE